MDNGNTLFGLLFGVVTIIFKFGLTSTRHQDLKMDLIILVNCYPENRPAPTGVIPKKTSPVV